MKKIILFLLSLFTSFVFLHSNDTSYVTITFAIDTSNHIDIANPVINLSLNNTSTGTGISVILL